MKVQVQAMLDFHAAGIPTVDYGNNIRQVAKDEGLENAFDFPGFVPAYIRPLFCRASARSAGLPCLEIQRISTRPIKRSKRSCRDNKHLHNWLDMARERIEFQGLPARICWVG